MGMKKIKQVLFNEQKESKPQMYQNVLLEFNSEIKVMATVKAFCFSKEEVEMMNLTEIKITEPRELPEDFSFSKE